MRNSHCECINRIISKKLEVNVIKISLHLSRPSCKPLSILNFYFILEFKSLFRDMISKGFPVSKLETTHDVEKYRLFLDGAAAGKGCKEEEQYCSN
jgi:hypothetical protein